MNSPEHYFDDLSKANGTGEDHREERIGQAQFQDLYRNIEQTVQRKEDITRVPGENVFDAAVGMAEEPEQDEEA